MTDAIPTGAPPAAAPAAPAAPASNVAAPAAAPVVDPAAAPSSDPSSAAAANPDSKGASAPPTGDGQGGADPAGDPPANADGSDPAAPEPYADFVLAEGFALEGERLNVATSTFRDLELTQEQAQKLIDLYPRLAAEDAGFVKQALEDQRVKQIEDWGVDSRTEFGARFDGILADAQAGIQWANAVRPNLIENFNKEGWGNHPDALWAFSMLGKLSRGSQMEGIGGGAPPPAPLSEGERAYKYATKPEKPQR